jgi:hypothetical protein
LIIYPLCISLIHKIYQYPQLILSFLFDFLFCFLKFATNLSHFNRQLFNSFLFFSYFLFNISEYRMWNNLWLIILLLITFIFHLLFVNFYGVYFSLFVEILRNFFIAYWIIKLGVIIIAFVIAVGFSFFARYGSNFNSFLSFNILHINIFLNWNQIFYLYIERS